MATVLSIALRMAGHTPRRGGGWVGMRGDESHLLAAQVFYFLFEILYFSYSKIRIVSSIKIYFNSKNISFEGGMGIQRRRYSLCAASGWRWSNMGMYIGNEIVEGSIHGRGNRVYYK
jgi:hypothetical protein